LFGIIGQENDNLRMNKAVQPLAQIPEGNVMKVDKIVN